MFEHVQSTTRSCAFSKTSGSLQLICVQSMLGKAELFKYTDRDQSGQQRGATLKGLMK